MKILFSSTQNHWEATLDAHFGRAKGFILYDEDSGNFSWHSNEDNVNAAHGAGMQSARFATNAGAHVIITGHIGPKAFEVLEQSSIKVYNSPEVSLKQAYEDFKRGRLQQQNE